MRNRNEKKQKQEEKGKKRNWRDGSKRKGRKGEIEAIRIEA